MSAIADSASLAKQRRVTIAASSIGTVIEWYDYMVYAFLATTLAAVFFPSNNAAIGILSALAVFGVSFFFRPLGGIIFGHIADRFGRRPALLISVVGMAATSTIIGLLPSYLSVGLVAPILLVFLRAMQGIAAGGEMASAATYTAESSKHGRRGFDVSFVNLGLIVGTMLGAIIVGTLYAILSSEQMLAWGWRLPFLLSGVLGILALAIRRHMEESNDFDALKNEEQVHKSPIVATVRRAPGTVLLVTVMNFGSFAAYYIVFTYMSTYFKTQGIMDEVGASWSSVLSLLIAGITIPIVGGLSDRIGRKPIFLISTGALVLLAYPLFLMMKQGIGFAITGQVVFGIIEGSYLGVLLAAYTELFTPALRVSGVGLGYNLSSIIAGGPAPFVSQWLIQQTGIAEAPAFFVMAASAASFLAAAFVYRETAFEPLPGTTSIPTIPDGEASEQLATSTVSSTARI